VWSATRARPAFGADGTWEKNSRTEPGNCWAAVNAIGLNPAGEGMEKGWICGGSGREETGGGGGGTAIETFMAISARRAGSFTLWEGRRYGTYVAGFSGPRFETGWKRR